MSGFLTPVATIAWKDVLLELRTRDIIVSVLVFALLVVIVFQFAVAPTPELAKQVAPGLLWVAFAFAGTLAVNRTFTLERDKGSLEGLLLCPVSRDTLFFGKALGVAVFMLVVEAMLLPLFAVLFNFPSFTPGLLLAAFLGTIGFAAVGTLFSAVAVNTRSREVMLPVLFFPVVLPVIIAAAEASAGAVSGAPWAEWSKWIKLIGVFDAIFLVVPPWVFGYVLEE